jgi:DNA repair protein RadD
MLIDEAHLYPRSEASMLGGFLKESGIRHVLGMTATPIKLENFSEKQGERFDKWSELLMLTSFSQDGRFFKDILHICQIQELVRDGFWSPLRYEVLPFDRSLLQLNRLESEYTEESNISAYQANNIRANIVAALDYHRERKHVLVFVPSVEEAEALASFIPDSAALSGNTPKKERTEIIRRFRAGEIRTIFNCMLLVTGFDFPKIDMIITGFSTASVAKWYQVAGRGVRIDPEKKDCVIVDAGGNAARFGKVEDLRFEFDGRWRMYGSGGTLVSGIPVNTIGEFTKDDVMLSLTNTTKYDILTFGKHKGKSFDDVPTSYLQWLLSSRDTDWMIRANILRAFENHVRDTRGDPPMVTLPDGQHAGQHIAFVPSGYLWWYYKSKNWNETNDSLRRGIELYLNQNKHGI